MPHGDNWESELEIEKEEELTTSTGILANCVPARGGASEDIPISGSDHLHS